MDSPAGYTAPMPSVISVPHLFAAAHGIVCAGDLRCFFCGAPCDGSRPSSQYVLDSFTGRNGVPCPGSPAVCEGCVLCLREDAVVPYHDGEHRHVTKAATRMHSWVITEGRAVAATKAHMAWLRSVCLAPPPPPYAIVLTDSGQKHLLYRGVVCRSVDVASVTLEELRIDYRPHELVDRLELCKRLVAATGKPALAEPPAIRMLQSVTEYHPDGEVFADTWRAVWCEPLSRLAAWLSPAKEEAQREYPGDGHGAIPAQVGRS
jgi:CRISPR type IV-associated protein Csf1